MKIGIVQMNAIDDKAANLAHARELIDAAVAAEAPDVVVLPEMFAYHGMSGDGRRQNAEILPEGETYAMLRRTARDHGIVLHGGSFIERDGEHYYNTTVVFDRDGGELARYRKIHLFDVTTPDGREYFESAVFSHGSDVVAYDLGDMRVGCSICYDLRFPELYQALASQGAAVIMVPSAFTLLTGKDHWEVLLRARAIETESYVVAPAQWGLYPGGKGASYGHSMIVDPWGQVVAAVSDGEGFAAARIDMDYLATVRRRIPVAEHKVL